MTIGRDRSEYFVGALEQLRSDGHEWVAIEELPPVAAALDETYMRRRAMLNKVLGYVGVERDPLPSGLRYPPDCSIYSVIDSMANSGVVEKDIAMEPNEHWVYRLADSNPEV